MDTERIRRGLIFEVLDFKFWLHYSEPNFWLLQTVNRAELLFSEVLNCLSQIGEKKLNSIQSCSGHKTPELRRQVTELEAMLQREKLEFEVRVSVILASFTQVRFNDCFCIQ